MVEADGEWHTIDNKYGSIAWTAKHPVTEPRPEPKKEETPPPVKIEEQSGKLNGQQKTDVSYILLSDDDDEEVQNELSSSQNARRSTNPAVPQQRGQKKNVIDLTLDSDEDEPAPAQPGKRKLSDTGLNATSPTEPIWKKGRHDDYQLPSITTLQNFRQPPLTNGGRLPQPPAINPGTPSPYSHYTGTSAPLPLASNLPIRGNAQGSLQLPLPVLPPPRSNGHPRWP